MPSKQVMLKLETCAKLNQLMKAHNLNSYTKAVEYLFKALKEAEAGELSAILTQASTYTSFDEIEVTT